MGRDYGACDIGIAIELACEAVLIGKLINIFTPLSQTNQQIREWLRLKLQVLLGSFESASWYMACLLDRILVYGLLISQLIARS